MPDRSEDFRREAARLLEAAQNVVDPRSRAEMIRLAEKFYELAKSAPADFAALLRTFTQLEWHEPQPAQQQQQEQPPKKEE